MVGALTNDVSDRLASSHHRNDAMMASISRSQNGTDGSLVADSLCSVQLSLGLMTSGPNDKT